MQATYCDICGERIRTKQEVLLAIDGNGNQFEYCHWVRSGVRKEVPIYYTDGIRWIESDICNKCVEAIAQCCSKLKEQEISK